MISALYRLALRAYPFEFRRRYYEEMARVFDEGLSDARSTGLLAVGRYCRKAAGDVVASAARERLAAMNRVSAGMSFLAIIAGGFASYIDFHATEVQATLLVLIAVNFLLGGAAPKGAWWRALMVAALLPAIHIVAYALGEEVSNHAHPYLSRLMIFGPALVASFLGAYAGVFFRFVVRTLAAWIIPHGGAGPGAVT